MSLSISPQGLIFIIIAASLMSGGSLGLQGAIDAIGGFGVSGGIGGLLGDIWQLAWNPLFIIGITLYGSGTLLWMRVLSSEDISIGYPILMSVAFIAITLGAAFFFKEAITPQKLIGMAIIVVGVVIATQG